MYAVIESGGKQYKVADGDVLEIERIQTDVGGTVSFDAVLAVGGDDALKVGEPVLSDVSVDAEVLDHIRGEKLTVFKMKKRKSYRRKRGHRQELTKIRIAGINTGSTKKASKKKTSETVVDKVEKVAEKAEEVVENTVEKTKKAVEKAEKKVEKVVDKVVEKAEKTVDKAAEKVEKAVEKTAGKTEKKETKAAKKSEKKDAKASEKAEKKDAKDDK